MESLRGNAGMICGKGILKEFDVFGGPPGGLSGAMKCPELTCRADFLLVRLPNPLSFHRKIK
jgi:hypothetical protein